MGDCLGGINPLSSLLLLFTCIGQVGLPVGVNTYVEVTITI